jgi:hypothetical protein
MLLADLCIQLSTRAPVNRPIPERAAFAELSASANTERELDCGCGAGPPCGAPTSSGTRLTPRLQLRPARPLAPPSVTGSEDEGTAQWRRHLAAAFSTACDAGERPLTLSVAPRSRTALRPSFVEEPRTASTASSSKGAASSAQSAFHRQVPPRARFREARLGGSPPPVCRLCHRRAGFRRAFAPPRSRAGRLDPASDPGAHHPWSRRATRRLSTSAIETIREHDRRNVRTPRTTPAVARVRSCFSDHPLSRAERIAGGRASRRGQPRCHGPGAAARANPPLLSTGASRRDRSRRELCPNPIGSGTSCRALVMTSAGVSRCLRAPSEW